MSKKLVGVVIIVAMLCLSMGFSFASTGGEVVNGSADTESQIAPRYNGAKTMTCEVSKSGGNIIPKVAVTVYPQQIDKVVFNAELQKKSGSSFATVKTWSNNTVNISNNKAIFSGSYSDSKGEYRVKVVAKCYKGSTIVDTLSQTSASQIF